MGVNENKKMRLRSGGRSRGRSSRAAAHYAEQATCLWSWANGNLCARCRLQLCVRANEQPASVRTAGLLWAQRWLQTCSTSKCSARTPTAPRRLLRLATLAAARQDRPLTTDHQPPATSHWPLVKRSTKQPVSPVGCWAGRQARRRSCSQYE